MIYVGRNTSGTRIFVGYQVLDLYDARELRDRLTEELRSCHADRDQGETRVTKP